MERRIIDMPIRKATGNMYLDVDWCWSPLVYGCQYQCSYCYAMKNFVKHGKSWDTLPHWASENFKRVDERTDPIWKGLPKLPDGKIFVCYTTDLFASNVPVDWIETILAHCWEACVVHGESELTTFVVQTKNPERLDEFDYIFRKFPKDTIQFGITLETNMDTSKISKAPHPIERAVAFKAFIAKTAYPAFVTIEPVMKFTSDSLINLIEIIKPDLLWIGADSKNSGLPEPDENELVEFFYDVREIVWDVRLKPNLDRLLPKEWNIETTKPS
jgi:DNA repair photolyase